MAWHRGWLLVSATLTMGWASWPVRLYILSCRTRPSLPIAQRRSLVHLDPVARREGNVRGTLASPGRQTANTGAAHAPARDESAPARNVHGRLAMPCCRALPDPSTDIYSDPRPRLYGRLRHAPRSVPHAFLLLVPFSVPTAVSASRGNAGTALDTDRRIGKTRRNRLRLAETTGPRANACRLADQKLGK